MRFKILVLAASLALPVGAITHPAPASAASTLQSVTVTGCVERDAASRADVFKLIAKADGGSKIYRLSAGGDVDLAGALGKTVEVTGTVGARDVLTVQKMRTIAPRCD